MNNQIIAGKSLLTNVRIGFISNGTSFSRWCIENQINRPNARLCIMGAWDGPKSRQLRERIVKAAGLVEHKA